ncbi:HDOD domain-containing protein [Thalassotalea sp. M1531]|uniref:HDOD domain-containing protein n=1 Tax=Thalassotalea algicola TaxID=2716224 RepID=A0A7Y0LD65_9GAMM|nr:HDOD domain-containing protein [Thalassotalea algicola]NMP31962.1 HDOD domain-containing protein [Thalassotalea algicola]
MKLLLVGANSTDQATLKKIFSRGSHQLSMVDTASLAVELVGNEKYDVVVVNSQLSETSISAFLEEITTLIPLAIRIVVTDNGEEQEIDGAHSQLVSPIRPACLVELLESIIPNNHAITKKVIVKAVNEVKALPSPPKVYMQLNALLKQESTDSEKIAEIISRDPALVAKVLQFVNSSAMSKGKALSSITDAITKMGVDTLCCIVMTAELFAYEPNIPDFSIEKEQMHSLGTARLAASIVKPELKQNALLAGLLHDIGKLVLFEINAEQTKKFIQNRFNSSDNILLEQKIFATDHAHLGGYLLHMWGFPYPIIEAVVLHHQPEKLIKKPFGVAHAIYIADALIRERDLSPAFIDKFKLESVLEKLQARADKLRM